MKIHHDGRGQYSVRIPIKMAREIGLKKGALVKFTYKKGDLKARLVK